MIMSNYKIQIRKENIDKARKEDDILYFMECLILENGWRQVLNIRRNY
jgi:hypothetical protein